MPAKKPVKAEPPFVSTRPAAFVPDPADPKKTIQVGPQNVDTGGYSGSYHEVGETKNAEPYKLKVVEDDVASDHYGRTHHLINQENFWTGSEKEFKEQFEKT
jgi:hypothetical protein